MNHRGDAVLIVLGVIIVLFFGIIIATGLSYRKEQNKAKAEIQHLGYHIGDVEVFCETLGVRYSDFMKSQSLRNQYEIFKSGYTTEFIRSAIDKKKSDDAEFNAMNAGMAVGVSMNSSN